MQILTLVPEKNNLSRIPTLIDSETGGAADQVACMLKYLRSLEHEAEAIHGDNDDWRYGRYLVHRIMIAVLKSAEMRSV